MQCPAGHPLQKPSLTRKQNIQCDIPTCKKWCSPRAAIFSCSQCDYDVCQTCHDALSSSGRRRAAAPADESPPPSPAPETPRRAADDSEVESLRRQLAERDAENAKLRTLLLSAQQSKVASGSRSSSPRQSRSPSPSPEAESETEGDEDESTLTPEQITKRRDKRVRRVLREHIKPMIAKRAELRAQIIDRLIIESDPEERAALRQMAGVQQERYLHARELVRTMKEEAFNAVHAADLVCNEFLSVATCRNINERFTTVAGEDGTAQKLVLEKIPSTKDLPEIGYKNPLTGPLNEALGIWDAEVRCPPPFPDDKKIAAAIYEAFHDGEMHLTVPTRDGYEGSAFDVVYQIEQVLKQAATDRNLRSLSCGRRRRAQVLFDKMGWQLGKPLTRWVIRTPDTIRNHNSTRYGRDLITYTGEDSWAWLDAAVKLGGDASLASRAYAGLEIKPKGFESSLPAAVKSDNTLKGKSLRELLSIECKVCIPCKGQDVELSQGGDLAAMHAAYGLDTPVMREGCCARCNLPKGKWLDAEACEGAWLRTFAYQCVANHINFFALPGVREKFPNHPAPKCPHCGVTVDAALEKREAEQLRGMTDDARKKELRRHSVSHLGAQKGKKPILPTEPRDRAESVLHCRTNATANNIMLTFMAVKFSACKRKRANALLHRFGVRWRFPEKQKKGGRTKPVQGNCARLLHTIPELLVGLFDIFYDEPPAADHAGLNGLGRASAAAAGLRGSEEERESGRKRPRKKAAPPTPVGAGGNVATAEDVHAYRERRRAAEAAEAAEAAAAPDASGEPKDLTEPEDDDGEEDEEQFQRGSTVVELAEDAIVGGLETAIDVWLASLEYQEALHARVVDDFNWSQLHAYASRAAQAGRAWAEAVKKHSKNQAPWQYVHRAYAHVYEDIMRNGQRDTTDDSVNEKGNKSAKKQKHMPAGTNDTTKTVQQTHHHQAADGTWTSTKSRARRLPKAASTQVHVKTQGGQTLRMQRPPQAPPAAKKDRKRARTQDCAAEVRKAGRTETKAKVQERKVAFDP